MIPRFVLALIPLLFLLTPLGAAAPPRPKLVVLVAVDQFRYDYLTRYRTEYTGGLKRLLDQGAVFVNARLEHYPTVTAIGHSTMLSGAIPSISGIVGNEWYDRESASKVTSVSDERYQLLGAKGTASSPSRLLVSTLGDEMKRANPQARPKVIGLSLKDRSAILPSGHMADGAFWYDNKTGTFVSSTYYFPDLPAWVKAFNEGKERDHFAGRQWLSKTAAQRTLPPEPGAPLYQAIYQSPFGNELLEEFAEQAISAEKLGQRGLTDLLTISFSSNDAVGHTYGPDSPEAHEMCLNADAVVGKLLSFLDKTLGPNRFVIAFTADHGVSPEPETLARDKMPGGRFAEPLFEVMQKALEERFGAGKWIEATNGNSPYFNRKLIREKKLDPSEVERVAANAVADLPHVSRVYRREQLLQPTGAADPIQARILRGFNARRSGDLEIILDPYWIRGRTGSTHGTPFGYDNHIPLIFLGAGIHPRRYFEAVALNDLAPTLAAILDVETPSGSVGRILQQVLE